MSLNKQLELGYMDLVEIEVAVKGAFTKVDVSQRAGRVRSSNVIGPQEF